MMKRLFAAVALAASLSAGAVAAKPITWTLNNVQMANGLNLGGSFVYDADTNTYSAINVTSTGGRGPFTLVSPNFAGDSGSAHFIQAPAAVGQNGLILNTISPKTNAGGTIALAGGGFFTCANAACTAGSYIGGTFATSGTIQGSAAGPVPTMSEWAMIILGTMLAGGAARYIQRRKQAA
jgi:hypothetical protein